MFDDLNDNEEDLNGNEDDHFTINEERLKEITSNENTISMLDIDNACDFINSHQDNDPSEDFEKHYLTLMTYALQCFVREGKKEFTTQEITDKVNDLLIGRTLQSLIDKNIFDVSIGEDDIYYHLTENGKEIAKKLIEQDKQENKDDSI